MAKHNEIGKIGEDIASEWLERKGFLIIERNYLKKWGEIDIVARETDGTVHFVEVKTVSYETKSDLKEAVSRKTWRPEENVHKQKQMRLSRAIQTWLIDRPECIKWQIDILTVRVALDEKYARVMLLDNVIFDL